MGGKVYLFMNNLPEQMPGNIIENWLAMLIITRVFGDILHVLLVRELIIH
jgi:hypothetical protein